MAEPTTETRKKLEVGASLKAQGATWSEVAQYLGLSNSTVEHWPLEYGHIWNQILVAAIDDTLGTIEAEALMVARKGLRDKHKDMRAAGTLLEHARKIRGERQKVEHSGAGGAALSIEIVEAKPPEDGEAEDGQDE